MVLAHEILTSLLSSSSSVVFFCWFPDLSIGMTGWSEIVLQVEDCCGSGVGLGKIGSDLFFMFGISSVDTSVKYSEKSILICRK